MFSISTTVNRCNLGYIPRGNFSHRLTRWLFGEHNLYKRLQAKDIMDSVKLAPDENILDFGCGNGYLTVEMAKVCKFAKRIDINNHIKISWQELSS